MQCPSPLGGVAAALAVLAWLLWIAGLTLPWWIGEDSRPVIYLDRFENAAAEWSIGMWTLDWDLAVGDMTLAEPGVKTLKKWQEETTAFCDSCQEAADGVYTGRGVAVVAALLGFAPAAFFTSGFCSPLCGYMWCGCCPGLGTPEAVAHLCGSIFGFITFFLMAIACGTVASAAWDVAMAELFLVATNFQPEVTTNGFGFMCAVLAVLAIAAAVTFGVIARVRLGPCNCFSLCSPRAHLVVDDNEQEKFADCTIIGTPARSLAGDAVRISREQHEEQRAGSQGQGASSDAADVTSSSQTQRSPVNGSDAICSSDAGDVAVSPTEVQPSSPNVHACKLCGGPTRTTSTGKICCKACKRATRRLKPEGQPMPV